MNLKKIEVFLGPHGLELGKGKRLEIHLESDGIPNGEIRRAQVVITGRNFAMMAAAFIGRYGRDGDRVQSQAK